MDARPKRAATIDELQDVAREVARFVERRRRRSAPGAAARDDGRDAPDDDRDPQRTVH